MKITFEIPFVTAAEQILYIHLDSAEVKIKKTMQCLDGDVQTALLELPDHATELSYHFTVEGPDGLIRREWGAPHKLRVANGVDHATVCDRWHDEPSDRPFHSSAFTACIFNRHNTYTPPTISPDTLTICVEGATVPPECVVGITGACEALGNWQPEKAIILNDSSFPTFHISIEREHIAAGTEYKFILLDKDTHKLLAWEPGENRVLEIPTKSQSQPTVAVCSLFFNNPMQPWRGAGVAIPVFSLRSENDWGVGDFLDLKEMADWAHATHQRFIQLLPVNDTTMTRTWTDSYPYNSISCFALHPMFLRAQEAGTLKSEQRMDFYINEAARLNALPAVDYEGAYHLKEQYTRELYAEQGEQTIASDEYKAFVEANSHWLRPYAAFCLLRDRYRTANHRQWEEYAQYTPSRIAKFISNNQSEIHYIYFIQYHLHRQLTEAKRYAHSLGVALKGDIPIGISPDSVDVWLYPTLFNLDATAGAPPDAFATLGQNWGFPTYNWHEMASDNYTWWKQRFRKMAEYFDAYRIDHLLGFFRIWQIPIRELHGLMGLFNPALPFTPEEMSSQFGFDFQARFMTTPYIRKEMIREIFGDLADEVLHTCLDLSPDGSALTLKPRFTTQRQIASYFADAPDDQRTRRLCSGLMELVDQVLFIEDPYQPGKYHPRIDGSHTYAYKALPRHQQWCFDALYQNFFYERHNHFWYSKAMEKLPPVIDATNMLVCGEDLGMIPACVPEAMHRLKILSLELQRMPKGPYETFGNTSRFPYLSVCTTSTHDMCGIRQWWEDNRELAKQYYTEQLHLTGEAPYYAEPEICAAIIEKNLQSPSMLCILPLQDWLATDGTLRRCDPRQEQINEPSNPHNYWQYRMHITLRQLLNARNFNQRIARLIESSGR